MHFAAALSDTHHCLLLEWTSLPALVIPTTDTSLIGLHDAAAGAELTKNISSLHCSPDPVAEIPSSSVVDLEVPLNLIRGDSFLCFAHHGYNHEPGSQGEMGVVEDCARRDRELVKAGCTLKNLPRVSLAAPGLRNLHPVSLLPLAAQTAHALGPADCLKVSAAVIIVLEFLNDVDEVPAIPLAALKNSYLVKCIITPISSCHF
jgi:hypothetical protein